MNASVESNIALIYEEVMWLAHRPNTTPSDARAWYTHIASNSLRKYIRRFSGMVSKRAAFEEDARLRLEQFKRMQTTLTHLIRHLKTGVLDAEEFVRVVLDLPAMRGLIGPRRSFYEAAFGSSYEEFLGIAYMPEEYIIYRRKHSDNGASDWSKRYDELLPGERTQFVSIVAGNQVKRDDVCKISSLMMRRLLEHYIEYN